MSLQVLSKKKSRANKCTGSHTQREKKRNFFFYLKDIEILGYKPLLANKSL